MKKLEELLNSLIQRGWKPFNNVRISSAMIVYTHNGIVFLDSNREVLIGDRFCSFRELVSIESGLWQFVCENGLLSDKVDSRDYLEDSFGFQSYSLDKDGWFWLMKSATIPEEMLEKFLLDNIKIED